MRQKNSMVLLIWAKLLLFVTFCSAQTWQSCKDSAEYYGKKNEYAKTVEWYNKAIEKAEKVLSSSDTMLLYLNYTLGTFYTGIGDNAKAEKSFTKSMSIAKQNFGEKNVRYAKQVNELGHAQAMQGKYADAEKTFISALEIFQSNQDNTSLEYANLQAYRASMHRYKNEYHLAEPLFREAIAIYKKYMDKDPEHNYDSYCTTLCGLGLIYQDMGYFDPLPRIWEELLNIFEKKPHEIQNYCVITNNYALMYHSQGDYRKAILYYTKAIEIQVKLDGKENDNYAAFINNLATCYQNVGYLKKADSLLAECLLIYEKLVGKEHYDYVETTYNIASLHFDMGNYASALQHLQETEKVQAKVLGKKHFRYMATLHTLALLYTTTENHRAADTLLRQILDARLYQLNTFMPILSEKERQIYGSRVRSSCTNFYSYAIPLASKKPELVQDMYNYQLMTKGILLRATQKLKQQILNSKDTVLIRHYQKWIENKNLLAKIQRMSPEKQAKNSLKPDSIERIIVEEERFLSKRSALFAQQGVIKNITWKDIQKELKPGQAAIEIISSNYFDPIGKLYMDSGQKGYPVYKAPLYRKDSIYYAALIITRDRNPEICVIPNGYFIDSKVYVEYKRNVKNKFLTNEEYGYFWKPIHQKLKELNVKEVFISAEGKYQLINISTLYNPQTKKYVYEELKIHLLTTTKDLISDKNYQKLNIENTLLIGYPNYGEISGKNAEERGFLEEISLLPATKTEVESIQNILNKNAIANVQVFTEKQASEEVIKSADNPTVLHIATHGYFDKKVSKFQKEPLMSSGLLLAGVKENDDTQQREDGLLTAYEVMNLNLDRTELVVLSACETGLGHVVSGEGVYGLQRAFFVAGTKSLMVSLWKVNDEATQILMTNFYQNWIAKKQDKYTALLNAQKELQKKYPDPYYWGAFILLGR
jgi:CHAT domain-containing protein